VSGVKLNKAWLTRTRVIQLVFTSFTAILFILLPLICYIQFKLENIQNYASNYDLIFILLIIIGFIITTIRFFIYKYPKYSTSRGTLNLIHSVTIVLVLIITSQIGVVYIKLQDSELSLNLMDSFIVLIILWALFIPKHIYDIVDFKLHHIYYDKVRRSSTTGIPPRRFTSKNLIKCPKCKYMCQITWKSCPICHTKLKKKF